MPAKALKHRFAKLASYTVLTVAAILVLFPLYMTVVTSLLDPTLIGHVPPYFYPPHPTWGIYADVFTQAHFGHYIVNSLIQSSLITIASVVTSLLAGYAFAMLEFPLKRTLFFLTLVTVAIPFEVTVTANYLTVVHLGYNATMIGMVLPFLASGFGIFLMRQAFLQVPYEIREASLIDGYGDVGFFFRVGIPLVRPMIGGLTLVSFLSAWNQYLWPLIQSSNTDSLRTAQIGLQTLFGSTTSITALNEYVAASIILIAPFFILLIFFQRQLIANLTSGAVK